MIFTRPSGALTLATILSLAFFGVPAQATTIDSPPYTFTKKVTNQVHTAKYWKKHPFGEAIQFKRVWGGRDATTVYVKMRWNDLPTAEQVNSGAPYVEIHSQVDVSIPANDGTNSNLGFTAGEIDIDSNGVTVTKIREQHDPDCHIDIKVKPKKDIITIAAPYNCGLPYDPTDSTISISAYNVSEMGEGAPKGMGRSSSVAQFTLPPSQ